MDGFIAILIYRYDVFSMTERFEYAASRAYQNERDKTRSKFDNFERDRQMYIEIVHSS